MSMSPAEETALAFLRQAPATNNLPSLVKSFGEALQAFGYSNHYCLRFARPGRPIEVQFMFGQPNRGWSEHYIAEHYERYDPGVKMLFKTPLPISWDQMRSMARSREEIQVFDAAGDHGLRGGLVIPVHDAEGGASAVILHGPHRDDPDPQLRATLAAMGTIYASHGQSQLETTQDVRDAQLLSLRERQCLLLASKGMTNLEIAKVLEISKRTVDIHIERARSALNASNRTHAVVEALERKLLVEAEALKIR